MKHILLNLSAVFSFTRDLVRYEICYKSTGSLFRREITRWISTKSAIILFHNFTALSLIICWIGLQAFSLSFHVLFWRLGYLKKKRKPETFIYCFFGDSPETDEQSSQFLAIRSLCSSSS